MRWAIPLLALGLLLSGCNANDADADDDWMMGPGSYHMQLSGMPSGPMAPGQMFNISVQSSMGMGMGMHSMSSDHIGAHFWNRTMMDSAAATASIGNSTACVHQGGSMPGQFTTQCTAPMQPGTYHIRSHARMTEGSQMHNYWSDEQTFTVA